MTLSVLILTGQSGSGKSTAMRTLEDEGYYCVDNVPTSLVEQLIDVIRAEKHADRLALVMDIRERHFIKQAPALVERLRKGPDRVRMVYLEAREEAVIRRYSETRRRHPLDLGCGLRAAIAQERESLAPLRELADDTLDTSAMSPHELKAKVIEQIAGVGAGESIRIGLLSFGFKHGLPLDADIVLDVRFLPNPYFTEHLRPLTGTSEAVREFVIQHAEAQTFLEYTLQFLSFLVPQYQKEGKRYLTVAVGCTGGRHRSVALAREIAERLATQGITADLRHRDLKEETL